MAAMRSSGEVIIEGCVYGVHASVDMTMPYRRNEAHRTSHAFGHSAIEGSMTGK